MRWWYYQQQHWISPEHKANDMMITTTRRISEDSKIFLLSFLATAAMPATTIKFKWKVRSERGDVKWSEISSSPPRGFALSSFTSLQHPHTTSTFHSIFSKTLLPFLFHSLTLFVEEKKNEEKKLFHFCFYYSMSHKSNPINPCVRRALTTDICAKEGWDFLSLSHSLGSIHNILFFHRRIFLLTLLAFAIIVSVLVACLTLILSSCSCSYMLLGWIFFCSISPRFWTIFRRTK